MAHPPHSPFHRPWLRLKAKLRLHPMIWLTAISCTILCITLLWSGYWKQPTALLNNLLHDGAALPQYLQNTAGNIHWRIKKTIHPWLNHGIALFKPNTYRILLIPIQRDPNQHTSLAFKQALQAAIPYAQVAVFKGDLSKLSEPEPPQTLAALVQTFPQAHAQQLLFHSGADMVLWGNIVGNSDNTTTLALSLSLQNSMGEPYTQLGITHNTLNLPPMPLQSALTVLSSLIQANHPRFTHDWQDFLKQNIFKKTPPTAQIKPQLLAGYARSRSPFAHQEQYFQQTDALYQRLSKRWPAAKHPQLWAKIQYQRGVHQLSMGTQKDDAQGKHLHQAIKLLTASLSTQNVLQYPVEWAATQSDLGNSYLQLALRSESPPQKRHWLKQAILAYQAALTIQTPQTLALSWAVTTYQLSTAYFHFSLSDPHHSIKSTASLQPSQAGNLARQLAQTLDSYLDADKHRILWSANQNHQGIMLQSLAEKGDSRQINRAIQAHLQAIQTLHPKKESFYWATSHSNLGAALSFLGQRIRQKEYLLQALQTLQDSLAATSKSLQPIQWLLTKTQLAHTHFAIGQLGTSSALQKSLEIYPTLQKLYHQKGFKHYAQFLSGRIQEIRKLLKDSQENAVYQ